MQSVSSPLSAGPIPLTRGDFIALMQGIGAQFAPVSTVGNGVVSAAALMAGFITRTGATAAFTDTTDNAANILAALAPNLNAVPEYGQTFPVEYANLTAYTATIAAGTGVTMAGATLSGGTIAVAAGTSRKFLGIVTSPTTITLMSMFALGGATA